MKSLKRNVLNNFFSHIYVEKEALNYKYTTNILSKFKNSKIVLIENYKSFFSANNQSYNLQKASKKLILAVKKDNFIYNGAKVCQSFGNKNFYYTASVINCIFDCEYCYLQGVYSSANIVVFVNIEDFFYSLEEKLKNQDIYLCISYDTDLLGVDNFLNQVEKWFLFLKNHQNLYIELRTKSNNIKILIDTFEKYKKNYFDDFKRFIIAYTISPNKIINKYENFTASLDKRLEKIKKLEKTNYSLRLCFDPIIYEEKKSFENSYEDLVKKIFLDYQISSDRILDVSIGSFRISKDYLKSMREKNENSIILNYPYTLNDGVFSYEEKENIYIHNFLYNLLIKYIDGEKIFFWDEKFKGV